MSNRGGVACLSGRTATAEEAATGADVVILATEWPEYAALDPAALGELTRRRTVVDARNALAPAPWGAAGWAYRGLGRATGTATTPTATTPTGRAA